MVPFIDIEDSIRLGEVLDELGVRVNYVQRGEHWANCPLPTHPGSDVSESFSVNENNLLWNCFTCNEGGKLPMLVAMMEGYQDIRLGDETIRSAWDQGVEWLLPFSDGPTTTDEGFLRQIESLLMAPTVMPRPPRRPTLPFMSTRSFAGLSDPPAALLEPWNLYRTTAILFGVKHDPQRRRFNMVEREEHIGEALVIPHYFRGELVGWQERWLGDRPDWLPKYTNTEDFPKAQTLWGYDVALMGAAEMVGVVEAAFTVMRLYQEGYPAVGTFGAAVSDSQIGLLRTFVNGVWIANDNDPDYINKAGRLVKGAGYKSRNTLLDGLCDYIPVDVVPPVTKEKGDLADVDLAELHRLLGKREPGFLLRPNPNRH